MSSMSKRLALSDSQMVTIMNAARPLSPKDRSALLRDLAMALADRELGDGVVARTCTEVFQRCWRAPNLSPMSGSSNSLSAAVAAPYPAFTG
jgi:hypothetical protein